jgi:hypothetical protein
MASHAHHSGTKGELHIEDVRLRRNGNLGRWEPTGGLYPRRALQAPYIPAMPGKGMRWENGRAVPRKRK